jgi:glutaredoxin-dependent peroxiredoxin
MSVPAAVGEKVPPFTLVRAVGDTVSSDELFAAGPTLIHFFPFAFTGSVEKGAGCEAQVCGFGARLSDFADVGTQVVAVSHDSPFVLKLWHDQLAQEYPFLSDWEWGAAKALGAYQEEALDTFKGLNTRAAFLVDRDGILRYAFVSESLSQLPPIDEALAAARKLAA